MTRALALYAILAGCGAPPAAAPETPARESVVEQTQSPAADAAPPELVAPQASAADAGPAPGGVLLTAAGNDDGVDGDETIELLADDTLRAGALSMRVDRPEQHEYFWDQDASLRVVALDTAKKRAAIQLATPTSETEDPPPL